MSTAQSCGTTTPRERSKHDLKHILRKKTAAHIIWFSSVPIKILLQWAYVRKILGKYLISLLLAVF